MDKYSCKYKFFLPPGAEDFEGLLYNFIGKGELGEEQAKFFEETLIDPYWNGISEIESARQRIKKDFIALKEAFPKANAKDLKRIDQLKLEGDPQGWDQIYNLYKALDSRQEAVQTVAPLYLNGQEINFNYKNYWSDIIKQYKKVINSGFAYKNFNNLIIDSLCVAVPIKFSFTL